MARFAGSQNSTRPLSNRVWGAILYGLIFSSCSSTIQEDQLDLIPITQTSHFTYFPNENLHFEVDAGFFRVGNLDIRVRDDSTYVPGKILARIDAEAHTRNGISFISKNDHLWNAWIDTGNGLSVRTYRKVRENNYRGEFNIEFFPDSNQIRMQKLHKPDKPVRLYSCRPDQMTDLVNMIWRFRFTNLENKKAGDTLKYFCFFDGEWLAFTVQYQGIKTLKWNRNKVKTHAFNILGIHSRMLIGENPVSVFIETTPQRRPLFVKISSYLGNLTVELKGR